MKYLWIGLGGCTGAIARYWLGALISDRLGTRFPYGTFAINMSGCFLIGLMITVLDERTSLPIGLRFLLPIGFVGAYTTFSTFEFETFRSATQGQMGIALLNVGLSVVVGYIAVYLGVISGRVFA
jgi:CrcB protein